MRTAFGLIGLGLVGGVLPAGLPGIQHAAAVLGGATTALLLLVAVCLAGPSVARRFTSRSVAP